MAWAGSEAAIRHSVRPCCFDCCCCGVHLECLVPSIAGVAHDERIHIWHAASALRVLPRVLAIAGLTAW
eukprot:6262078-Lingulodinium_polyedra.AAC.1